MLTYFISMISLNNKKGLHSRKSSIFILLALVFLSLIYISDIKYDYIGITGFAVNILADNDALITVNTEQEIGTIRNDFYGANTHGAWMGEGTKIDKNGDGIKESNSNLTWHRQAWLDSGMKMMRWDMYLESNYEGPLENLGFEDWSNSSTKYITGDSETGANGWKVSSYAGGAGYVSRSSDAYSGNYALKINATFGDHLYLSKKIDFREGKNYNFSVWVKGNGTFEITFQRLDDYTNCGYKYFVLNDSDWRQVSVICNANNSNEIAFRIVVDAVDAGEYIIIDDLRLTEDGVDYNPLFRFVGDLRFRIDQLEWAHNNDIKVLLIASYMPSWLANSSIIGCDLNKLQFCPPKNYTLWGSLVNDYLNRLTKNNLYSEDILVEVWNEPDVSFLLPLLVNDDSQKSLVYNRLYGSLIDTNNYSIGGSSLANIYHPNLFQKFLNDFSSKLDILTYHIYSNSLDNVFKKQINYSLSNCFYSSANCKRVIISEWNTNDVFMKNVSANKKLYYFNLANSYYDVLNNWPSNVSMILYQWSEDEKYSATQYYNEYPQKWNMVSEPGLDNEFTPAYNVTKNFAHFHAGGDMVVNSSSDNSNIKVVSSMKSNGTIYTTVISTATINTSVSVVYDREIYGLKNIETNALYLANNGEIDLGVFSQYDVKYYVEIQEPLVLDTTAPSISIINPKQIEYSSFNVPISIGINEIGYCSYTLDGGKINNSISSQNALNFSSSISLSFNGDYTLRADCYDLSVNRASSEISFSVYVEGEEDLSDDSTSSGGGGGGSGSVNTQTINSSINNEIQTEVVDNNMENEIPDSNENSGFINDSSSGKIVNSNRIIEPQKGIIGRVISGIEDSSGKSIGYIIVILGVVGVLLFTVVAMIDAVNIRKARKQKYGALKDWIGKNHSKGYEHDDLREVLLKSGWDEKLVDKAIYEHKDKVEDDKYRIPFSG